MPSKANAIVIGTGVGGLSAAAYLGKLGFDVLALDQAEEPGGLLRPYRFGQYRFSWAVHYVGMCHPGQMLHRGLSELGLDAAELFCEIEPDGFDVYRFPDFEIKMCSGLDAFRDRLATHFPAQIRGLDRYFEALRALQSVVAGLEEISKRGGRLVDLRLLSRVPALARWMRCSYAELLDSMFDDPKIKAVLTAPCGNWALPASKVGALYPLANFNYYADGAFFPRGGSDALRDALMTQAKSFGVEFRCNADVAQILVQDRQVNGVALHSGERIDCDVVVSDVDPVITYSKMIDEAELPKRLLRKTGKAVPSLPVFWVFLGMNRDLRAHGMGANNIWDHSSWNVDEAFRPAFEGRICTDCMLFVSPNSLKDDSHTLAPPGKSTIEAITWVPFEPFAKWERVPADERGVEYEQFKTAIGNALVEELDKRLPGVVGDVEVMEFATPVDMNLRTRALRGGIYGPALTPEQTPPRRFGTRSPIRNLFLVGSGVFGGSIGAGIESGKHAARLASGML